MIGLIALAILWAWLIFPFYERHIEVVMSATIAMLVLFLAGWLYYSGRAFLPKRRFTIVFCLRADDPKSIGYIRQALSLLKKKLDELGLLEKFKIISIGRDIIIDNSSAHAYRDKHDVDLIIWGDVFYGSKENKDVCDFKGLSFTFKVPGSVVGRNLSEIFKSDINIALVNRDWNIYEINSLPGVEKISANLSEVIMFVLGIIYCQYREYAEDSVVILEHLFHLLKAQINKDEKPILNEAEKTISMTPQLFRHSRVLGILLSVYKNLGSYFAEHEEYQKGSFYVKKFRAYDKKDIGAISTLALCEFHLGNIQEAKSLTDEICAIDKNHEVCLTNRGFLSIYEKKYASALYFYKEIIKRGRVVSNEIIFKVLTFLDERKTEAPGEFAYDFAVGILNVKFCDEKLGRGDLRKFVKKTTDLPAYKEMHDFAKYEILETEKLKRKRKK
jgi:tetratricopeptide (TPR) repeat protein